MGPSHESSMLLPSVNAPRRHNHLVGIPRHGVGLGPHKAVYRAALLDPLAERHQRLRAARLEAGNDVVPGRAV